MKTKDLPEQIKELVLIPFRDKEKIPAVAWKDYREGLTDDEFVTYGVNCGLSNIIVIDLDINHGNDVDGLSTWFDLLEEYKQEEPETFTVSTANGGRHLYFKLSENDVAKNKIGLLKGIDIRANGGCVIGPGSIISSTDKARDLSYQILDNYSIASLPEWLRTFLIQNDTIEPLNNQKTAQLKNNINKDQGSPDAGKNQLLTKDMEDGLKNAMLEMLNADEGERNKVLNKEAYKLAVLGISREIVDKKLKPAAMGVGLPIDEIDSTITSAMEAGYEEYERRKTISPYELVLIDALKKYKRTDKDYYAQTYVTERFAASRQGNLRYISERKEWIEYQKDQGYWASISSDNVRKDLKAWLAAEAEIVKSIPKVEDEIKKLANSFLRTNFIEAIYRSLQSSVFIYSKELDAQKDLIVCKNGVVNLKTMKITSFKKSLFSTKHIPYNYYPNAESSIWDKIISCIDDESRKWVMMMAGQSLTGYTPSTDFCIFLNGSGANGKTTFLDILNESAGTYYDSPAHSTLLMNAKGSTDFNLIGYKGLRQAVVEELPDERQLDVLAIKRLVGTRMLSTRAIYGNTETFELQATLWISCNRLPIVVETDHGTWRRLIVVPFNKTYRSKQTDITNNNDLLADPQIKVEARTNIKAIEACLAERVKMANYWYHHNEERKLPPAIQKATDNWRITSDHIQDWLNNNTEYDQKYFTLTEDLFNSFNDYMKRKGNLAWSYKLFLDRLMDHQEFRKHQLDHTTRGRTTKFTQSKRISKEGTINIAGEQSNHIKGIKFKE